MRSLRSLIMFANKTRQTHITYQAYNVLNQLRHWDIPEFRRITTHYWWHCWQVIVNSLAIQKNVPIHTAIIVTIDSVCTTEPLMVWASPQIAVASQLWLWRHSTDIDRRAGSSTQLSNALQCSNSLCNRPYMYNPTPIYSLIGGAPNIIQLYRGLAITGLTWKFLNPDI